MATVCCTAGYLGNFYLTPPGWHRLEENGLKLKYYSSLVRFGNQQLFVLADPKKAEIADNRDALYQEETGFPSSIPPLPQSSASEWLPILELVHLLKRRQTRSTRHLGLLGVCNLAENLPCYSFLG